MGAHHCKVAGASKVFRKRKPTTSRRQSQTQAEKRFKEGEHNDFSDKIHKVGQWAKKKKRKEKKNRFRCIFIFKC